MTTCIGRHDTDPPLPEPGLLLCRGCRQRLRTDLDTVGRLRIQLDPAPGRSSLGRRSAGKPGSRPPANLTVIAMGDTRSRFALWHCGHQPEDEPCPDPRCGGEPDPDNVANVDADLLTEARWVIEQRGLNPPMHDVFDSLRIINIHLDWICAQDHVDEFAAVIGGCAHGLRAVLHDWPESAVGRCTAAHPTRDTCGGPLRMDYQGVLPDDPDAAVAPTHIVCAWCSDTWPIDVDTLLGLLRVARPKAFPVSRQWAADVTGVAPGTLDVWCHRGHVTVYGDKQVNLMDVLAKVADTPTPADG